MWKNQTITKGLSDWCSNGLGAWMINENLVKTGFKQGSTPQHMKLWGINIWMDTCN